MKRPDFKDIPTLSSSHRDARPPSSILRRRPTESTFSASLSSSSLDSYTSLPPPISRFGPVGADDFNPQFKPRSHSQVLPLRRRSSKVRFFDESSSSGIEIPSPTSTSSLRRRSSVERLHQDLARSTRVLSLDVDDHPPRTSATSFASVTSDQFDLGSPLTRVSIPESEDGFVPQALSYPRLARRASYLSVTSLSSRDNSLASTTDSSVSSAGSPSGPLLAMVNRPSLSASPRQSVSISIAPHVRDSFGSIASTLLSSSGTSSLAGSMTGWSSDASNHLPRGLAYSALLPSAETTPNPDRVPTINRRDWRPDLGLSPRSSPSPIVLQNGVMEDPLDFSQIATPHMPMPPGMISPLEMTNPFENSVVVAQIPQWAKVPEDLGPTTREAAFDSIDLLPASRSVASTGKGHHRTESSLSAVLSFPLPPSRMFDVTGQAGQGDRSDSAEETSHSDDQSGPSEICLDTPRPDFGSASTFSSPPSIVSPPTSPTLGEMVEVAQWRRKSQCSDEDVELGARHIANHGAVADGIDISSPLLDAAVSSGILSPNSSRLSPSPTRGPKTARSSSSSSDQLRSGRVLTSGRGWSGSESEEEEFVQAIRSITLRKLSAPRLKTTRSLSTGTQSSSPGASASEGPSRVYCASLQGPRPSLRSSGDRHSQLSSASSAPSGPESAGPLTPASIDPAPMSTHVALSVAQRTKTPPITRPASAASSSGSTIPGDYPWGRSSAPASPTGSIRSRRSDRSSGRTSRTSSPQKSFYEDLSSSLADLSTAPSTSAKKATLALPPPTRKVEGWGRPEVLTDEKWDMDAMWDSEDEMGYAGVEVSRGSTPRGGVTSMGGRAASPDVGQMMARGKDGGHGKFGSLFDETLDEVGVAL